MFLRFCQRFGKIKINLPAKNFVKVPCDAERGSIALEYVLVTAFTAFIGMALLTVATHWTQSKLEEVTEKLGLDLPYVSLNPFTDN